VCSKQYELAKLKAELNANQHELAELKAELCTEQKERFELKAELCASKAEVAELKAELCATQYGSQLTIFAAKAIFKTHAEEMQRKHWLNTRAVVQTMTTARSSPRAGSRGRRSQSLPPPQQVQNVNAAPRTSRPDQGNLTTSSGMQPVGAAESTSQSQPRHIQNEGPQFSHPSREHNIRNAVLPVSSRSNSEARSSSSRSDSPRVTSQGSRRDSQASTCESVCLDGDWEMVCDDPEVETWLKRFSIRGATVHDGEGQTVCLTRNPENQICFEGGALVLDRDVLHRIGKSGKVVSFRRRSQHRNPR